MHINIDEDDFNDIKDDIESLKNSVLILNVCVLIMSSLYGAYIWVAK